MSEAPKHIHLCGICGTAMASLAGLAQLPQHAVHLIGFGAGVFKEEQLAFGVRFESGAEQRNKNAETATVENAVGPSGLQSAHAFRCAYTVRPAGKSGVKAG